MSIKDLFTLKKNATTNADPINSEAKLQGETYVDYGRRICGMVYASKTALATYIQKIYNQERQAQANDQAKQNALKEKAKADLAKIEAEIEATQNDLNNENAKIATQIEKKNDATAEKERLKASEGQVNRSARIRMIVGCIILIPLTLYLFVFYSSTFYSAFFKDFSEAADLGVKAAMFDAQAVSHAFDSGITELLFVLSAPIIFMGLGYCLHIFSTQRGKSKYLKLASILSITFIFDCILAFLIAKSIYDTEALNMLGDQPTYTLSMAFTEVNFWAVIFCGFIVYLIWGIVFNIAYTAYENLRSNKAEICAMEVNIASIQQKIDRIESAIALIKKRLTDLNGKKGSLQQSINNNIYIDKNAIRVALTDFFSGWTTVMPALGKSSTEQEECRDVFVTTTTTLLGVPTSSQTETTNKNEKI